MTQEQKIGDARIEDGGGCTLAGPGRGDCWNFLGLPGKSIPGMHDGPDDTVDHYGKPNGWCWSCWKSEQIQTLSAANEKLQAEVEKLKGALKLIEGITGNTSSGVWRDHMLDIARAALKGASDG